MMRVQCVVIGAWIIVGDVGGRRHRLVEEGMGWIIFLGSIMHSRPCLPNSLRTRLTPWENTRDSRPKINHSQTFLVASCYSSVPCVWGTRALKMEHWSILREQRALVLQDCWFPALALPLGELTTCIFDSPCVRPREAMAEECVEALALLYAGFSWIGYGDVGLMPG
jgi:hypothetical protein